MQGFSPVKKHANKFNYIPRYYDPAKEAREQRRAELHGQRSDDGEYSPGQYIRTQRAARDARRASESQQGSHRLLKLAGVTAVILLVIYMLYPRLVDVFGRAQRPPATVEQVKEAKQTEFDPAAPITIVPNDYQE